MRAIAALTPEEAPEKSRELLEGIIGRHGSAGAMVATMAHSPALLQGYRDFSRAMKRVKLPRPLSEKVSIAADDVTELRGHGWTDRTIADVVGLVGLNLLTGSFNLVAGIRPEND